MIFSLPGSRKLYAVLEKRDFLGNLLQPDPSGWGNLPECDFAGYSFGLTLGLAPSSFAMTMKASNVHAPAGQFKARQQWPPKLGILIDEYARQGMKFPRKTSIARYILLGAAFTGVVRFAILYQPLLYPNPESKSIFLKNYTPTLVVESFRSHRFNSAWETQEVGTAGPRFVTSEHVFGPFFAIQYEQRLALMQALSNDIDAQIRDDGGRITSRSGDPLTGVQFNYRCGKNLGMVTLSPPLGSGNFHNRNLPAGIVDMKLTIAVTEHWYPAETDAIQASLLPFRSHTQ